MLIASSLLAVQIHLPNVFFRYIASAAKAVSARHAPATLHAFSFAVLLYNGGVA